MPSAERFKRFALIAIISLVIGVSTLANLLKQTTPPEDALARAVGASERPPASPIPVPRADVVPTPAKAAKPEVPTPVPPSPVTTAAVPAPSTPALSPASVVEPSAPAAPSAAQAGEFPPMQPMTDEAAKPAAAAAAAAATAARPQRADTEPQRRAEKPAAEKPVSEKPDVRRAADAQSTKRKSVRPAPYSMRDFLASHR